MKVVRSAIAAFVITTAAAQTPANFSVVTTASLQAYSNPSNTSLEPGILIASSDVAYSPSIYLPESLPSDSPYIGIQVDGTINALHWIQPNLVAQPDGNLTVDSSVSGASTVECPYIQPEPPAGAGPHNYVILLFEQPPDWTIPSNYSLINPPATIYARLNFSLPDFLSSSGLSSIPLGATFYRVMNGTAQQSSIEATATFSGPGVPAEVTTTATTTGFSSVSGTATVASYTAGAIAAIDSKQGLGMLAVGGLLFAL